MGDWKLPWDGGCRCGATRLRISAVPYLAMACHCTGCQTMSASAFSLSLSIPSEGFAVTQGEPVLGGLKRDIQHYFCPSCSSWMFTRAPGFDWFVNVRATMLDDHRWFVPFVEFFTVEKLPWATTPARHSFEKFPAVETIEPITREYAEQGARPA